MVLCALASKYSWSFKRNALLDGEIASGGYQDKKVILLFPTTYMNLSGRAVRKAVDWFKISLSELLILSDDIALPFEAMRYRDMGSSGGHNGLKDIEGALGTRDYSRLRLGVGMPTSQDLKDYVLSPFDKEEQEKIPDLITRAVTWIEEWLIQEIKEQA